MKLPDNLDLNQIFYLPLTIHVSIFFRQLYVYYGWRKDHRFFSCSHADRNIAFAPPLHQNNSLHNIVHNGKKNKK